MKDEKNLKEKYLPYIRIIAIKLHRFGVDLRVLLSLKYYPLFRRQKNEWLKKGGKITHRHMVLSDYRDNAGEAKGHYFHQDLLVAQQIFEHNPPRHIDVGSRVDGFVAHVASFREIEILDIRHLPTSPHKNIIFRRVDILSLREVEVTESLSSLHAIEHFGLGRYSDPIDVDGHKKGIDNLVSLVKRGGRLYIGVPIGLKDEVHFNAHRVFHPTTLLKIPSVTRNLKLLRFDFVDDFGNIHLNTTIDDSINKVRYGCGIYTFEKVV